MVKLCTTVYDSLVYTSVVLVEVCPSLLAVRTRLVCAILLYALTTEQLSTFLMLPWIFSYSQANETLQGIVRFRDKLAVITTWTSHCRGSLAVAN